MNYDGMVEIPPFLIRSSGSSPKNGKKLIETFVISIKKTHYTIIIWLKFVIKKSIFFPQWIFTK